jgi:hypothetical protein
MRIVLVAIGLLLFAGAARADKGVMSGHPLVLYRAYATNPDCTAFGPVEMRLSQPPEHGRVSIHSAGVFPQFPDSNVRSVCNRHRVRGVEATYVSQRGYLGPDYVALEVFYPAGRVVSVRVPIQVR